MSTRCLITGHDAAGNAVFASDSMRTPSTLKIIAPYEFTKLWSADRLPQLPNDGAEPGGQQFFPPPGGVRFFKMTVPPASARQLTPEQRVAGFAEMEEVVPGLATHMEKNNPGLHTSDSIDFGYVIDGEIWLDLARGVERRLAAGDTFVQTSTRHAWRNKSDRPCTIIFVTVGAARAPIGVSLIDRPVESR